MRLWTFSRPTKQLKFNLLSQENNKQSIEHSVSINESLSRCSLAGAQRSRAIQRERETSIDSKALSTIICTKVPCICGARPGFQRWNYPNFRIHTHTHKRKYGEQTRRENQVFPHTNAVRFVSIIGLCVQFAYNSINVCELIERDRSTYAQTQLGWNSQTNNTIIKLSLGEHFFTSSESKWNVISSGLFTTNLLPFDDIFIEYFRSK